MRMYDARELRRAGLDGDFVEAVGITKAFAIRREIVALKHEVKAALKAGHRTVDIRRLNERLQHIAKLPRPGYAPRCPGKCACLKGIV